MTTLYTQQSKNITKTWMLMALFLVIVITAGYFVGYQYDNPLMLYIAIIFAVVMNIAGYWFSDKIALSLAHARLADRTNAGELELIRIVENLSITAGLPSPRVYIIDDPSPNAFATGRDKHHAAVAVTSGLLAILNRTELEGVLAHELSHIGNRDTLLSTVVVVLVGFISILADIFLRSRIFGIGGGRNRDEGGGGGNILAIIGIVFIILSPIIATLIQLAISRKREFLADASGALLTRYPEGLASALEKIAAHGEPLLHASHAMAHLYISNPFGADASRGFSRLFMTHPPVEDRINALLQK